MKRLIRILRAAAGLACLVAAAWWAVETVRDVMLHRPLYGVDVDTGEPTGLRVSALSPAEAAAALELEDRLRREWLA